MSQLIVTRSITDHAAFKSVIRTPVDKYPHSDDSNMYCTQFRPCNDLDCDHLNCDSHRRWAEQNCPHCHEAIGYDRAYFFHDGYFIHALCLVEAADEN